MARAFSALQMSLLNGLATQGLTRRVMVVHLNDLGVTTPSGGAGRWERYSGSQVTAAVKRHNTSMFL
jgi:hypothetical protein